MHRRRYLRNQSYVSTSVDSALSPSAPAGSKPCREAELDLFSETLSPLKENYGSLVKKIKGQRVPPLKGHRRKQKPSAQTMLAMESPLKVPSAVSTFEATVLTPQKHTPSRKKIDSKGSSPGRAARQETAADFSTTASPYKENYDDIRAKLNAELFEAEAAIESIQVDSAVVHRPAPPPPRRGTASKQAFSFDSVSASSPDAPEPNSSGAALSGFRRSGRKLSPSNEGY